MLPNINVIVKVLSLKFSPTTAKVCPIQCKQDAIAKQLLMKSNTKDINTIKKIPS